MRTTLRASVLACAALALMSCAAQTETASPGEDSSIVVTGSRIPAQEVAAPPIGAPPPPPPPPAPPPPPSFAGRAAMGGIVAAPQPQPLPGAVDRDNYEDVDPNPVRQVATEPVSTFSIDVDTAAYSNARRFLTQGRLPPRDSVRVEELINYFDYDYPLPRTRQRPFEPSVTLVPSPWSNGRTLMHIGLQGFDAIPAQRPPLNLVLLLDVSGSMSGGDRLPLAIQGFRMLVDQLEARDRVSIVVYAGAAGAVLEPTPGNERARINAAFDQLQAGGSTAGGAGLELAYALARRNFNASAINRVMIATDGDFNVGIANIEQLEDFIARQRETGIYLSVLGFGGGNYNDALMQRLAQKGNGQAAYIDTLAEARRVLSDEMTSTLFPIANDVKIQVEFNPGRVAEYRLIGYETRMLRREDFNNDRVDAGDIGAGHSVTAIYELTPPGGNTLIDPLRYQSARPQAAPALNEIAFVRIRYKLPGETESREIVRPVVDADASPDLARAPERTRWATAVAAYGQLLRGDPYLDASYGWNDVIALAQDARGRDEFGWRAEFVQLARTAAALTPRRPEPKPPGQ
ncbi:MAG: VWA domain-containing protein [Hyphomonadaceae bacterium]|nr:VWA domain-containing protein [Hyphomonadaceae bacterium]